MIIAHLFVRAIAEERMRERHLISYADKHTEVTRSRTQFAVTGSGSSAFKTVLHHFYDDGSGAKKKNKA